MSKKPKTKEITNVEFGIEFGDMNTAKMYETPFVNQSKKKDTKKNK
jgi:hypothetical protein